MQKEGIKMGRDKFISLMGEHGYHVIKKRRYKQTTNSKHKRKVYNNLIKHLEINGADVAWASDITYVKTAEGYMYLSLVTDLYTRRIMGYSLGNDLSANYSMEALKMAIKTSKGHGAKIHHSDRGIQYCSEDYIKCLRKHNITSSMTRGGSPQENAVAERLNGILKQEYNISDNYQTKGQCRQLVKEAVELYNRERPHSSLGMKTPDEFYNNCYK